MVWVMFGVWVALAVVVVKRVDRKRAARRSERPGLSLDMQPSGWREAGPLRDPDGQQKP